MRKLGMLSIVLGIAVSFTPLYADFGFYYNYGKYEVGQSVRLFGDNVNIREKPSTQSKVIGSLSVADKVEIVEQADTTLTLGGYKEPWYKIKFDDKGKTKTGYVWGGLLAKAASFIDIDEDGKNEIVVVGIVGKGDSQEAEIRLVNRSQKILSSLRFEPIGLFNEDGSYGYSSWISFARDVGLTPKAQAICVEFAYEACDYPNGCILILWNGKELVYGFKALSTGNEFGSVTYNIIYPFANDNDTKRKNYIMVEISSVFTEEESGAENSTYTQEKYTWDGSGMLMETIEEPSGEEDLGEDYNESGPYEEGDYDEGDY